MATYRLTLHDGTETLIIQLEALSAPHARLQARKLHPGSEIFETRNLDLEASSEKLRALAKVVPTTNPELSVRIDLCKTDDLVQYILVNQHGIILQSWIPPTQIDDVPRWIASTIDIAYAVYLFDEAGCLSRIEEKYIELVERDSQ